MAHTIWECVAANKEKSREIAGKFEIPGFAAHLLTTRGFTENKSIEMMLGMNEPDFCDPFEIKDMDKAAERIETAIENFEKIAVFGDYDVDGITAASMLFSFLEMNGANAFVMLPDRVKDGYGIRKSTIDYIADQGATLIVTVDNGISAVEEAEYAASLGIDMVITDHHQPGNRIPNVIAVVNPHRRDDSSGFKHFCGAGVVFKLLCAICGDWTIVAENYADLAALGTVADVMPLVGENRLIVRLGLERINSRERFGIDALIRASGLGDKVLTATDIAYTLAPRINAAGRMGEADRALHLLLSEEPEEAADYAAELCEDNSRRQNCEIQMASETAKMLDENPNLLSDKVLVIDGDNWNIGIIGIYASRMCEGYGKPCIIISRSGDISHASGRSLPGFSLFEALQHCSELLELYGGHEGAAGLTIKTENIPAFRKAINEYADSLEEMPFPKLRIDCELQAKHLNMGLVTASQLLEPFGEGNPVPVIGIMGCVVKDVTHLKNGAHQKLLVGNDTANIEVMFFSCQDAFFPYKRGDRVDIAVRLTINEFRNRQSLSAVAVAIKPSGIDRKQTILDERLHEAFKREAKLSGEQLERLAPQRSDVEVLYRYIREKGGFGGDFETLYSYLPPHSIESYARMLCALDVLAESGLVATAGSGTKSRITFCPVSGKVDIEDCNTMKRLHNI